MATPMLVPIVVAAGRGRRVGADKALLAFDGTTLI